MSFVVDEPSVLPFCGSVGKPGEHSHVFCSLLQIGLLDQVSVKEVEGVQESEETRSSSESAQSKMCRVVFEVDLILLY